MGIHPGHGAIEAGLRLPDVGLPGVAEGQDKEVVGGRFDRVRDQGLLKRADGLRVVPDAVKSEPQGTEEA